MSTSMGNEIRGPFDEVKDEIKKNAGQIANDADLEAEGNAEHQAGKIEKKVGQIRRVFESYCASHSSGSLVVA